MMTVNEVSRLTGVSIRTLQYYDKMGLLKPTEHTAAGYRLYDNRALENCSRFCYFANWNFRLRTLNRLWMLPVLTDRRPWSSRLRFLY